MKTKIREVDGYIYIGGHDKYIKTPLTLRLTKDSAGNTLSITDEKCKITMIIDCENIGDIVSELTGGER